MTVTFWNSLQSTKSIQMNDVPHSLDSSSNIVSASYKYHIIFPFPLPFRSLQASVLMIIFQAFSPTLKHLQTTKIVLTLNILASQLFCEFHRNAIGMFRWGVVKKEKELVALLKLIQCR